MTFQPRISSTAFCAASAGVSLAWKSSTRYVPLHEYELRTALLHVLRDFFADSQTEPSLLFTYLENLPDAGAHVHIKVCCSKCSLTHNTMRHRPAHRPPTSYVNFVNCLPDSKAQTLCIPCPLLSIQVVSPTLTSRAMGSDPYTRLFRTWKSGWTATWAVAKVVTRCATRFDASYHNSDPYGSSASNSASTSFVQV